MDNSSMEGGLGKGSSGKDKGSRGRGGSARASFAGSLLGKEATKEEPQIGGGSLVGEDKTFALAVALSYAQCLKEHEAA